MAVGSLAEEGPTDADDRRALLDRGLEVVGHAHRESRVGRERAASDRLVADPSQGAEGRARACWKLKDSSTFPRLGHPQVEVSANDLEIGNG